MKIIFFLVLLILTGFGSALILDESNDLEVTRHRIGQEKGGTEGLRIAQISDLHIVGHVPVEEKVLQEIKRVDPHVILLTGDILPYISRIDALDEFLTRLGEGSMKIAILGNWEYWSDLRPLKALYRKKNVTLLVNEAVMVGHEPGRQLLVVGLDDVKFGKIDWDKAMSGHRDWRGPLLVLAHNPVSVDLIPSVEVGAVDRVVLSGHTHGGQIRLFGWFFKPYGVTAHTCMMGWCRKNGVALYVSRGIGTSILPLRIGARPELTLFEWIW